MCYAVTDESIVWGQDWPGIWLSAGGPPRPQVSSEALGVHHIQGRGREEHLCHRNSMCKVAEHDWSEDMKALEAGNMRV